MNVVYSSAFYELTLGVFLCLAFTAISADAQKVDDNPYLNEGSVNVYLEVKDFELTKDQYETFKLEIDKIRQNHNKLMQSLQNNRDLSKEQRESLVKALKASEANIDELTKLYNRVKIIESD